MARLTCKWILAALIILAVVLSGYLAWQRYRLEQSNRQVELAVDYADVLKLASRSQSDVPAILDRLKGAGVTAVLFKEQILPDLEGRQVWTQSGNELLAGMGGPALSEAVLAAINPQHTYFLTRDYGLWVRMGQSLGAKSYLPAVQSLDTGKGLYLTGVPRERSETGSIGLGFPADGLDSVRQAGLNIIPQIRTWPQFGTESLSAVFQPLEQYRDRITVFLFNDAVLPGHPKNLKLLAGKIREMGSQPVGLVEFFNQKGINDLARALDKQAVRLHAVSASEMGTITQDAAVARFTLAASERNIRVLFVRLFFRQDKPGWLEANLDYLGQIRASLSQEGFTFGPAAPFGSIPSSRLVLFLIGLGVLAGGALVLAAVNRLGWGLLLFAAGALIWAVILGLGQVEAGREMMALGAAIVFPTLAVVQGWPAGRVTPAGSVGLLWRTSLLSLAGALLVVGILADINFMLKIQQFVGVKAVHLLPPVLVCLLLFVWPCRHRWRELLKQLWNTPVRVKYIVLFLVLAVGGFIYLTRTGNEGAALVPGLERRVRQWLDFWLAVRPRTKEFLIGHPLLLASFYLGRRERSWPLVMLGVIGQVSLINTFAHIHTPLAVSLLRVFNGLWLGTLIGLVLLAAYRWLEKRWPELNSVWGRRSY